MSRPRKRFVIGKVEEFEPGSCKIITVDGKSIGIYHVNGTFHALLNYCPHKGAELCTGPITGTSMPCDDATFTYTHKDALVRCAWHGWEFEIATGQLLYDSKIRVKTYPVEVVDSGEVILQI